MRHFSLATWVFLGLLALGIASVFNSALSPKHAAVTTLPEPEVKHVPTEAERTDGAKSACMWFVQHSLNDPSSADFDGSDSFSVKKTKDGVYHVRLGVRARNAFNALVWGQYDCEVLPAGDSWIPLKVRQRLQ